MTIESPDARFNRASRRTDTVPSAEERLNLLKEARELSTVVSQIHSSHKKYEDVPGFSEKVPMSYHANSENGCLIEIRSYYHDYGNNPGERAMVLIYMVEGVDPDVVGEIYSISLPVDSSKINDSVVEDLVKRGSTSNQLQLAKEFLEKSVPLGKYIYDSARRGMMVELERRRIAQPHGGQA